VTTCDWVFPVPTLAVPFLRSITTPRNLLTSIVMPPSVPDQPARLCLPLRARIGTPF
jgi:hypothetical protein